MDLEWIATKIIPLILVAVIVFVNMLKMKKQAKRMQNGCGSGCNGCAQQATCTKPEKK